MKNEISGSRVFLTGRGFILGGYTSIDTLWRSVQSDDHFLSDPPAVSDCVEALGDDLAESRLLSRHQLLGLAAAEMAWREAGFNPTRNSLRSRDPAIRHSRVGFVGGSSLGGLSAFQEDTTLGRKLSPFALFKWRGNAIASAVSIRFGLGGNQIALNSASATGSQAIALAGHLIRSGMLDAAVVVGADCLPMGHILSAMNRNHSRSHQNNSRPLSPTRSGMHPVEGSACIILESERHLDMRKAKPICEWLNGRCESEAFHPLAPNPSALVMHQLITDFLSMSIDWVSLHSTGTLIFDPLEVSTVKSAFGEHLPWLSAFKRTIGHTLSAAGVFDALLLSKGLEAGEWPIWPKNMDHLLNLPSNRNVPSTQPNTALQLGQGMGGLVTCNLWRRL